MTDCLYGQRDSPKGIHAPEAKLLTYYIHNNVFRVYPTRSSCCELIASFDRVDDVPWDGVCLFNQYPLPVSLISSPSTNLQRTR
jgi:hypothetical protein